MERCGVVVECGYQGDVLMGSNHRLLIERHTACWLDNVITILIVGILLVKNS